MQITLLNSSFDLLIGLGIFLLGMHLLEGGIRQLSSKRLKQWLAFSTASPVRSAGFGTLITAILQSSSMVSLLVLAFTSAGIMPLYNAIGILLGANVGTTATGWVVTAIGFKLNLESLALPLLGLSAFGYVISKPQSRSNALSALFLGLGLLLFGLSQMKDAVALLPQSFDLSLLQDHQPFVYLLFGICLTALIQSSSATMLLTLTALHANIVDLPAAAAIVIGADLGTTSTTVLGSLAGSAVKKQLAMAHCMFNLIVDLAAFFILLPLLPQLLAVFSLSDPLFSLVAFHSLFNVLGLAVFIPLMRPYSAWIGSFFNADTQQPPFDQLALKRIPVEVPEAALAGLLAATETLCRQAMQLILEHFGLTLNNQRIEQQDVLVKPSQSRYQQLKTLEYQILQYALEVQQQALSHNQAKQLEKIQQANRALVYACKTLNDIDRDLSQLYDSHSPNDQQRFRKHQTFIEDLYSDLVKSLSSTDHQQIQRTLEQLVAKNTQYQQECDREVYTTASPSDSEIWLSTQLNLQREIHHATSNAILAIELLKQLQHIQQQLLHSNATQKTLISG
ncbi:hypothetical protein R50073_39560 [Maricurvus nonylphenolicus]